MRHSTKRIIYFILAVMLLIVFSALPAIAEETEGPVAFPGEEYFGKTWPEIVNAMKNYYGNRADIDNNSSIENKTLEDGTVYTEGIITDIPSGETGITEDHFYYLVNGQMVACIYKYNISENFDINEGMQNLKRTYGTSVPLDISTQDPALLEMLSDQVQIKDGSDSWVRPGSSDASYPAVLPGYTAVTQLDADPHIIYVALLAQSVGTKSPEIKMSGLSGTEDLTPEEITMLNTYIDFVRSAAIQQINDFIVFLKSQRNSSN